jgi:beta-alanine--pyruvate transaminase
MVINKLDKEHADFGHALDTLAARFTAGFYAGRSDSALAAQTLASASLTGLDAFHKSFDLPFDFTVRAECAHYYRNGQPGESEEQYSARLAANLEATILREGPDTIAAMFVEAVMGAGGAMVPPKGYFQAITPVLDKYGIFLVDDEVICGFGRTGKAFAAQSFGVTPDLMTMAKGITNGAQPMGAVAVSERVHDTIIGAAAEGAIEFFHGYTYSAHPAPCAAGLATLDIYRKENLFERGAELSPYFLDGIWSLKDLGVVADLRGYGMLAAIDVHPDGAPGKRGHVLQKKLFDNGLHLKTTGDCAIIAPPLIAEKKDVDIIVDCLRKTLATV